MGLGAGTLVVVFHITAHCFRFRFSPVLPSLRTDVPVHMAADKSGFGEIPPGASQIDGLRLSVAGKPAVREHKTEFLTGRGAGGSDKGAVFTLTSPGENFTLVKKELSRHRLPERVQGNVEKRSFSAALFCDR